LRGKNGHRFQPGNASKAFGGRALPGPAGGAYSAPPDSQLDLRGMDKEQRRGDEKTYRRGNGKEEL